MRRQSGDISQRTIQNPSDSLNLLAQAAFNDDSNESIEDKKRESDASSVDERFTKQIMSEYNLDSTGSTTSNGKSPQGAKSGGPIHPGLLNDKLGNFCLVQRGIVAPITLRL